MSFPLALLHLAPRHLELTSFETYTTAGTAERIALRYALPLLSLAISGPTGKWIDKAVRRGPEGPNVERRAASRWTILAEARSGQNWRNVVATGSDPYGLTAETLAAGALTMAAPGYEGAGVLSPVQAVGLEPLRDELARFGVAFDTYAPV